MLLVWALLCITPQVFHRRSPVEATKNIVPSLKPEYQAFLRGGGGGKGKKEAKRGKSEGQEMPDKYASKSP